jgi:hypothetical protein
VKVLMSTATESRESTFRTQIGYLRQAAHCRTRLARELLWKSENCLSDIYDFLFSCGAALDRFGEIV